MIGVEMEAQEEFRQLVDSETRKLPHMSRICELPDDILVCVLSLLPLKEAGMTSILSKRWRHLWEDVPTLNFDASDLLYYMKIGTATTTLEIETPPFIRWVDEVVRSHKSPALDDFKLRFDIRSDLDGETKTKIDSWIRFAIEKRVKRLTLDLSTYYGNNQLDFSYTFPSLPLCKSLTSLVLAAINIAGEVLESFLFNCASLEYLSVSFSNTLIGLKVAGPSLSLKHLKIHCCSNIKQLEISAPKLASFRYVGEKIRIQYQSLPKLVDISFGHGYAYDWQSSFSDLGCHVSQIEELKLDDLAFFKSKITEPVEYPVFKMLKKLDMQVKTIMDSNLFYFVPLIKACPLLHHLKLRIIPASQPKGQLSQQEHCPHYNMKIVEIAGINKLADVDLEFVLYLLDNAVCLDKVILDSRFAWLRPSDMKLTPERSRALKRADEQVRPRLKPGTELVLI